MAFAISPERFPQAGRQARSSGATLDITMASKPPLEREVSMPARRLSMRKLAEVLRLRFELKLSYQQIARSCSIALSSVNKYLTHAQAAGIGWPLPEGWNDAKLKAALFPPKAPIVEPAQRTLPDFGA